MSFENKGTLTSLLGIVTQIYGKLSREERLA